MTFEESYNILIGKLPKIFEDTAFQMATLFQAFVEENFEEGQGTKKRLGVRSGRLVRSIIPNQRDNVFHKNISAEGVSVELGTTVPYGLIWEQGFGAYKQVATERQVAFFWSQFYKFNEPKFRAMALKAKHKGFLDKKAQAARPFLKPANDKMQNEGIEIVADYFVKMVTELLSR